MTHPPQASPPSDPHGSQPGAQQPSGQQFGAQQPVGPQPEGQQWQPVPPQGPQHGASAPGGDATSPRQGEAGEKSGLGKGPILAMVGCGLMVLVLLLALVGFFGVRALMGAAYPPASSQEEAPADEGPREPEEETTEPVGGTTEPVEETTESVDDEVEPGESPEPTEEEPTEEAAPGGEANAVPKGTVITLEQAHGYEGSAELAIGDVNWDAADWVNEQNSHNPQPTDQGKYIMVQTEITYHGPDEFNSFAFVPVDYVAADGTPYEEAGVVTPDTLNKLNLQDGQSGTVHWVFMMPADVPEGGHFVIADALPLDEALVEGQWIEAA